MKKQDISHRKGAIRLRLTEPDGAPWREKIVQFKQIRHKFLFGCGAFEAVRAVKPATEEERLFYTERMEQWLGIFNYGTLPFYWRQYEPKPGKTLKDDIRAAAAWLSARGVALKGHPLCWHTLAPQWLNKMNAGELAAAQEQRIEREVMDFRDLISMWDVVNEAVIMPVFTKEENGITRLCQAIGRVGLIRRMFAKARELDPGACLVLNDFNTTASYEMLIDACLDAGVSIDAIGIQSHQHQGYWGREKLEAVLDRFSRFGLSIHFTENTFISGDLMPPDIEDLNDYQIPAWPTTPEGEERQARNVEEFYRILFAHPQVEAITTWAFQDNAWLGAPAGLVRADNSVKPAYKTLKSLIQREWRTETSGFTDEQGVVEVSGFAGDYLAVAGGREMTFQIKPGWNEEQELIMTV